MKKKYTSKDGRIVLYTPNLKHNHNIYLGEDLVGSVIFSDSDLRPQIRFDESYIFDADTLQLILKTANEASEDINVKYKHLHTLKEYQSWRRGDIHEKTCSQTDITNAIDWAIKKIKNDDT